MKLSAFLGLAGALGVLFGLEFLLIPEMALAQYGVPTAAPNLMQARYFGSTLLAFGPCGAARTSCPWWPAPRR